MSHLKFTTLLLGTAAALLTAAPSLAQDALEEIVVTARRQEESLQRTPVSVSALSGAMLDRLNVVQVDKIAQFTPNVSLTEASGAISGIAPFIRGIGNQEPLLTVDSPVGVYLNGIYIGRQSGALFDLLDLQRVEVLRGPQGTLFGRNTTGGAINLVTKAPGNKPAVEQKFTYGSYDEFDSRTLLRTGNIGNSPISATLGYSHRQHNGYIDNVVASKSNDPGAQKSDAGFVALSGDFDGLKADYLFDYSFRKGKTLGFQIAAVSPDVRTYYALSPTFLGDPLTVAQGRLDTIRQENGPKQFSQVMGHSLTLQHDINDALAVKSITGYRMWRANQYTTYAEPNLQGIVLDPTTFAFAGIRNVTPFHAPLETSQHQWSQELQLLGQVERWKYVGGVYYFSEHVAEYNPTAFTFVLPGGVGLPLTPVQQYTGDSKSYAVFGQTSYTPPILDDKLSVTVGLRYTTDKRSLDQDNPATPGTPALTRDAAKAFHNAAFNTSVDYQWTDSVMTYARVGSGYRSGGFNARAPAGSTSQSFTFNPEKALTVEGGFKTEFFDHRLRANAAGFYTRYRNLQIAQYTGGQGTTQNANARFTGFEVEAQAILMRGLTIDGSVGYVNPEYTKFPYPVPSDPTGATIGNFATIAHFPYVPKWTNHVGAEYAFAPMEFGTVSARVDYSTSSRRWFHALNLANANPFNDVISDPGQRNLSARLTLSELAMGPAQAEISVWGENLSAHDNVMSGIDFGGLGFAGVTWGAPRRFGVDLKISY